MSIIRKLSLNPNAIENFYAIQRPGRDQPVPRFETIQQSKDAALSWRLQAKQFVSKYQPIGNPFEVHYVCLLGWKEQNKEMLDEVADFYEGFYNPETSKIDGRAAFEALLNSDSTFPMEFTVHHFPTINHKEIENEKLIRIREKIRELLAQNKTVFLGCSAAMSRTGMVLEGMR